MATKSIVIISSSVVVGIAILYFAFDNKKKATQKDIAGDEELKELITKIDNAPK